MRVQESYDNQLTFEPSQTAAFLLTFLTMPGVADGLKAQVLAEL